MDHTSNENDKQGFLKDIEKLHEYSQHALSKKKQIITTIMEETNLVKFFCVVTMFE